MLANLLSFETEEPRDVTELALAAGAVPSRHLFEWRA
jgi:hypothetical protein